MDKKYTLINNNIVENVVVSSDENFFEFYSKQYDYVDDITDKIEPISKGYIWNPKDKSYTAPEIQKTPINIITPYAFRSKFTLTEKQAIYQEAINDINIKIWLDDLQVAQSVDLFNEGTIAGVNYLRDKGLLTEGRVALILEPEYK